MVTKGQSTRRGVGLPRCRGYVVCCHISCKRPDSELWCTGSPSCHWYVRRCHPPYRDELVFPRRLLVWLDQHSESVEEITHRRSWRIGQELASHSSRPGSARLCFSVPRRRRSSPFPPELLSPDGAHRRLLWCGRGPRSHVTTGYLTFLGHRHLPYKRMLIATGVLLTGVLFVMVGEEVNELHSQAGLRPQTSPGSKGSQVGRDSGSQSFPTSRRSRRRHSRF